ncbi:MAG: 16S rRNA (adenine(1518)-N(6)/adenine(1519)-N(6))-dimethyltransferase RsmA [Patescibacteria group bacterium]
MDNLQKIKLLCQAYNIFPSRQKGQNFLVNEKVIEQTVAASDLSNNDLVLEVGPGLGILTEALVQKAKRVVSVELDKKLFSLLKGKFAGVSNLELVEGDILKIDPLTHDLKPNSYKIVANLPYNITSHFLKKFLSGSNKPLVMTLLLQKEVAQRICAQPGQMSLLAISVQLYGQPQIIGLVSNNNFWPKPKIDSAILKISKIKTLDEVDNYLSGVSEKIFWQIVRIGFSAKRKQLQNNLAAGLHVPSDEIKKALKQANFDPKVRAQDLAVVDWIKLAKKLDSYLN